MALFSFVKLFGHITPLATSTWHSEMRMGSMDEWRAQHVVHLKVHRWGSFSELNCILSTLYVVVKWCPARGWL